MPLRQLVSNSPDIPERSHRLEPAIWSWANIYKVSFAIFALNDLGVLKFIAARSASPQEIAEQLDLNVNLLTPMLQLLVAVGVLMEDSDGFRAPPGIETISPLLTMESRLSGSHVTSARIAEVVRGGEAASIFQRERVEEYLPIFTEAMRSSAHSLAPYLVRFGNLRACRRLLDLGGADGSLAFALRRLVPGLSITVADLPRMQPACERQIATHDAAEAVQFVIADLRSPCELTGLFHDADAIIISNVLHLLPMEKREELYRTIQQQAKSGSTFLIYDQFIDDTETLNAEQYMTVDWVINGVQFRETAAQLCATLQSYGFSETRSQKIAGLPGALIAARIA